jgi:hypothetical protein
MRPRPDPRFRLILTHLEHASGCLGLCPDAPPGYEGAGEGCITEVGMLRTGSRAGLIQSAAPKPFIRLGNGPRSAILLVGATRHVKNTHPGKERMT